MLFANVTWQANDHNETALPYVYEAKANAHFSSEKPPSRAKSLCLGERSNLGPRFIVTKF